MEYQAGAVRPVDSFSDGWAIIKNDYWLYVGMVVVVGIIVIAVSVILNMINGAISGVLSGALGAATSGAGDAARTSAAILPQIIQQIIGIFVNIVVTTLSAVLICGIYKSMSRVANGGRAEFGDLFSGFEHFMACFIVAVIMSIVQFVIALAAIAIGAAIGIGALGAGGLGGLITKDGQPNPAIFGGLFLVILAFVGIYLFIMVIISILTIFVYPLIAERHLSGGQALLVSAKSGLANVGGIFLLLLVGGLMILVSLIPCGLGVPFVAPIYIAGIFSAYRSVFGSYGDSRQYNPPAPPTFGGQQY